MRSKIGAISFMLCLGVGGIWGCGDRKPGGEKPCRDCGPAASCDAAAAGSILAQCQSEGRACVEANQSAACGQCLEGRVEVGGACEPVVSCSELDCASQLRDCDEVPNGHCTTCVAGYVEGELGCRLPRSCEEITCPNDQNCVQPQDPIDAYCQAGGCGAFAIEDADGICRQCRACDDILKGEDGPYLAALTGENRCICKTLDDYYWSSSEARVEPCDEDGDGWTRESAKLALESADAVIVTNARCDLRRIDAIELLNTHGESLLVPLSAQASLYETNRNDDQSDLDDALARNELPAYGDRALRAEELNSLTKGCVAPAEPGAPAADFNQNNLSDVDEWHGNPSTNAVLTQYLPFVDFAYFLELHRGWYVPPNSGTGPGHYVIAERSRLDTASPGNFVAVAYDDPGAAGFSAECSRFRDADYDALSAASEPLNGFDFARFSENPPERPSDAGFSGMNHHSQYKCVVIVDAVASDDPPHWLTPAMLTSPTRNYTLNACSAAGAAEAPASGLDALNPHTTPFACNTRSPAMLGSGDVGLVSVGYRPYTTAGDYVRGCVAECAEYPDRCDGWDANPVLSRSLCASYGADFGRLFCGCDEHYAGAECEIGCPGQFTAQTTGVNNLFVSGDFDFVPTRTGWWMCGASSLLSGEKLIEDPEGGGYSLRPATTPAATLQTGVLCQTLDCASGYVLR